MGTTMATITTPPHLVRLTAIASSCALFADPASSQPGPPFNIDFKPPLNREGGPGFGPRKRGPTVGDQAPDFELTFLDSQETFHLNENFGKRPTVLIFHSFT